MAKSAEEYRDAARRARALAKKAISAFARETLLRVATTYDNLAEAAEKRESSN